jgi:hypothetical protein
MGVGFGGRRLYWFWESPAKEGELWFFKERGPVRCRKGKMAGRQRLERLQQLGEGGYLFAGYGKCGWLDRDGFRFRVSLSFPWCFQNCPLLFYVLKTPIYRQKYCQVPKLGPSTSLFFL